VETKTEEAAAPVTAEVEMDEKAEALLAVLEKEMEDMVVDGIDEECVLDPENPGSSIDPELCEDPNALQKFKSGMRTVVGSLIKTLRNKNVDVSEEDSLFNEPVPEGELLEQGWEKRGNSSAIRRNAEVWKFALSCVFKALKPRSMRKKGASEEEINAAKTEAANFITDGLLRLGPTFVKLGQVVSTRTDVLSAEYINVLKNLQDNVPGFSGARAKEIISKELGRPCDEVFTDFSEKPLAAASLGQVHTAMYNGKKVAVKVQRANLKELFDVDLKNLKKLAVLLDKFDPKTDGADRNWVSIYEESERLLYLEIDYLNEADNGERFARDFKDTDWVRVPEFYREVSTPRILCMEYVDSFKLTNIEKIDSLGLDKNVLAKRTADAFLRQIIETGYFHCDPHP